MEIPEDELEEQFIKASGAGGQHVNKVSTAVQLRWSLETSSIPDSIKQKFKDKWPNRVSQTGDVIVQASAHRSQLRNRQAARKKLQDMLDKALERRKARIPTRPGRAAVQKRIKAKKIKGDIKARRGRVRLDKE